MFRSGLVRLPGDELVNGIRNNNLPPVNTVIACNQHALYREALQRAGLALTILEADTGFPDGPFVEDTAVVVGSTLVITRPGDIRRRGEEKAVENEIGKYFDDVLRITGPGCLDGGDVLVEGHRMWIGLSERTNREGAEQLKKIGEFRDFDVRITEVKKGLHLKTYVGSPGPDTVWIHEEIVQDPVFDNIRKVVVEEQDTYVCNCRYINGYTVMAEGFPRMEAWCRGEGLEPLTVPMSEYRKLDGGISCLSVVW